MRRAASSILVLCACAASFGQFSSSERKGIADALYVGNLKVEDLGYAKRPYAGGGYGIVRDGLNKPLETSETLMGLHASAGYASVSTLLTALIAGVYDEPWLAIQHDPPMSGLDDLPDDLRRPILGLANWINSANNEIKHATERLTPEEKRALIESLPELAVADPSVRFSYVHGTVLTPEEAKSLLAKVDLARIRSAAARLAEAIERAIEQLKVAKSDFKGVIRERVGGMPIVVAGTEDDVHTDTDAVLTVDLGGNDTYKGRHGAGVGYT
ncbi:MAG TPA: hypothetical protein VNI20_10455, partial [Fimbriimonadaceae bacterium]|nr:hypothetical protein [Fimbriimonadaceae bacterium]